MMRTGRAIAASFAFAFTFAFTSTFAFADGPRRVLSLVGTNDLHGHVEVLPTFAGYVKNLRAVRAKDGGAVMLLDGGDLFQGTLESNLEKGAPVVDAYNAIGYHAVALGNHEFDYGPVGESTFAKPGEDCLGALKARCEQAKYPVLAANVVDRKTRKLIPGTQASTIVELAGLRIGVVGLTTSGALTATLASNVATLEIEPLVATAVREAKALRARGADLVFVAAHAGGKCGKVDDAANLKSCDLNEEIFQFAAALPPGAIDAIVGGHTHAAVAHRVAGIPIIESYSVGRAFGRIDFTVEGKRVVDARIFSPTTMCKDAACAKELYEGAPVVRDAKVAEIVAPAVARAEQKRSIPLGVIATTPILRSYDRESPLGNLIADLMRAARPTVDVALMNGGGLRAELPSGPITYGRFYEVYPFDNRFAQLKLSGRDLKKLVARNLAGDHGFLSLAGVRAKATCANKKLVIDLERDDKRKISDDEVLTVVLSDFLATGGDGFRTLGRALDSARLDDSLVRDELIAVLKKRKTPISADEKSLFDPAHPRVEYSGTRPLRCRAE